MRCSLLFLLSFALASASRCQRSDACYHDNCARQVSGTRRGPAHTEVAKSDCSSFMMMTVTAPLLAASATARVVVTNITMGLFKRANFRPVPAYASSCTDAAAYSSACSCFGIKATLVTPPANSTMMTVTGYNTATLTLPSTTTSSPLPACTADLLLDAQNCGECGNVCLSGVCEAGSCTNSQCIGQTCGSINGCDGGAGNCYCFSSSALGFCGQNAVCAGLTACGTDSDCVTGSSGNICAVSTCCPHQSELKPGVCLEGQCGNPAERLMTMAKMAKSNGLPGLTAAY